MAILSALTALTLIASVIGHPGQAPKYGVEKAEPGMSSYPEPVCVTEGDICSANDACCEDFLQCFEGICQDVAEICEDLGGDCSLGERCCGDTICSAGVCKNNPVADPTADCVADGESCDATDTCCSSDSTCTDGTCQASAGTVTTCVADGLFCLLDLQCCDDSTCNGGLCGAAPTCVAVDPATQVSTETCTTDADCCPDGNGSLIACASFNGSPLLCYIMS